MSVTMTIRDVPDETRNALASKAALEGQSMQEYVRRLLIQAGERRSQSDVLEQIRERARTSGRRLTSDAIVDFIRADRLSH